MLHRHFFEHARTAPDRPALNLGGRDWSYAQLGAEAERIGLALIESGCARAPIALLADKSPVAYAGMLGVLAAGGVHVPLNRKFPPARNAWIAHNTACAAVIADAASLDPLEALLHACARPLVVLLPETDPLPERFAALDRHSFVTASAFAAARPGLCPPGPDDPARVAYIIHTSGSTGRPKGVAVRHESIDACIESLHVLLAMAPQDRCSQFAELSFDFSIGEIFLCWRAGATLCVPSESEQRFPAGFVTRNRLSVWSSVPTMAGALHALRALKPAAFPSLRLSYFCGEALPATLARAWALAAPNGVIANLYGPTEAAVFATCCFFDPQRPGLPETVPIGDPLPTVRCALHAEEGACVDQDGEIGELWLGGVQVAEGYANDPAATAAVFLDEGQGPGVGRWYRTGDLVSRHPQHGLIFHGRADRQVKVRGFRVELQEVEMEAARVLGCERVAVLPARSTDGRCEALIAVCSSLPGSEAQAREACASVLPPAMVPQRFFALDAFPCSLNGKLDLTALGEIAERRGWLPSARPESDA